MGDLPLSFLTLLSHKHTTINYNYKSFYNNFKLLDPNQFSLSLNLLNLVFYKSRPTRKGGLVFPGEVSFSL